MLSVAPDGSFLITTQNPAWTFGVTVGVPLDEIASSDGRDGVGTYEQLSFQYSLNGISAAASVRAYRTRPVVIFSTTLLSAAKNGPLFPRISTYPQGSIQVRIQFHLRPSIRVLGGGAGQSVGLFRFRGKYVHRIAGVAFSNCGKRSGFGKRDRGRHQQRDPDAPLRVHAGNYARRRPGDQPYVGSLGARHDGPRKESSA